MVGSELTAIRRHPLSLARSSNTRERMKPKSPTVVCPQGRGLKHSTSEEMRTRFFNMIGIEAKLPPVAPKEPFTPTASSAIESLSSSSSKRLHPSDPDWVNPRSENVTCFTEALKFSEDYGGHTHYGGDYRTASATATTSTTSSTTPPKRRRVETTNKKKTKKKKLVFSESVKVIPIPMRTEYSSRVRSRLWSGAVEIHENASRNTIEFAAEG